MLRGRAAHAREPGLRLKSRGQPSRRSARRVDTIMRRLGAPMAGLEEPAVEKIAQDQQEDAFQVLIATMLSAQTKRCGDACRLDAAVRGRAYAAVDGPFAGEGNRAADLSGQLLSAQGGPRKGDLRADPVAVRRPGPRHDDVIAHAPGSRTQDRQSRADSGAPQCRQHLRRHPRAPHFEPSGLGGDADARRRPSRRSTGRCRGSGGRW